MPEWLEVELTKHLAPVEAPPSLDLASARSENALVIHPFADSGDGGGFRARTPFFGSAGEDS